mmetsp:Transcript_6282/g.16030  ORF Transcript_6282/g.16030 Transcript_6282/m.16030 type:complete len:213 (-) Transcript_6282:106-744(-)
MGTNRGTQLFVFFLEQGDRLLQRFEQELLADARALGVFAIAFTTFHLLLFAHLAIAGPSILLLLGGSILQVIGFLRSTFKGHGGGGFGGPRGSHGRRSLRWVVQMGGEQTTSLRHLLQLTIGRHLGSRRGNLVAFTRAHDIVLLLLRKENGVTLGRKDDISKNVIQVQGGRSPFRVHSSLGFSRQVSRSKEGRGYVLVAHGGCWMIDWPFLI